MSRDEALRDRLFDRRREVHVVDAEIAGARIEHARLKAGRRQLHERMTLAHRDRFRHWNNFSNVLSGWFAGERQSGFNFGVLRKVLCIWQVERAAGVVESISA